MNEPQAWAAGLFDGEGSVYLRQAGRYPRAGAMLTLEMTDLPTVERFAAVVPGGRLYPARVLKGNQPLWKWRASSLDDVVQVSRALLPYAVTKQAVLQLALDSCLSAPTYKSA